MRKTMANEQSQNRRGVTKSMRSHTQKGGGTLNAYMFAQGSVWEISKNLS